MCQRPTLLESPIELDDLHDEMTVTLHQFAESLGIAIDAKDSYTRSHSCEVAEIALVLAQSLNVDPLDAEFIHIGGHLHDIGKIGVPDHILKKQGVLTKLEWRFIHQHPIIGARILEPVGGIAGSGNRHWV